MEVQLDDNGLAEFYQNKNGDNKLGLLKNQYLLIKDNAGEIVDQYRWDGFKTIPIKFKTIDTQLLGKIKPRNIEQKCYFDLLDNENITIKVGSGGKGVGKSFIATNWALSNIFSGKYEKLVITRNPVATKNAKQLGYTPGSLFEKLGEFMGYFKDIVSKEEYDNLLYRGQVELVDLAHIRGRTFKSAIVMVSEIQNTDVGLMKDIVSRVGENSILILEGDISQTDARPFEGNDNGMIAITRSLCGNDLFGMVTMNKCERSKTAALAELIK
ncbi:MAG: PhoH family protein [Bacilli bacterium]|nr:PhoH family protein [Bacilli bacterium]